MEKNSQNVFVLFLDKQGAYALNFENLEWSFFALDF